MEEKEAELFWELLKAYYAVKRRIREKNENIEEKRRVTYDGFVELEKHYRVLKDLSHLIFREPYLKKGPKDAHRRFDSNISTLYHVMAMIKEEFYTLRDYKSEARDQNLIDIIHEGEVPEQVRKLCESFEKCDELLYALLPEFKKTNLPRLMFVNITSPPRVNGHETDYGIDLDKMFEYMFGNAKEGYDTAYHILKKSGLLAGYNARLERNKAGSLK